MSLPYGVDLPYDIDLPYGGEMALRRMWDAAFPPSSPPRWEVAAGYIGPAGVTPHVWTAQEWDASGARWRLPIFVRPSGGDPTADATFCTRWLAAHSVAKGATLALDYETRIDAAYLTAFDNAVSHAGWKVMVYGTRRTVLQNPEPSGGYWDAQWTNVPHLNAGSAATQYGGDTTLGQPYDASLVADSTPLWDIQEVDLTQEEHDKLMAMATQVDWLRNNVVALRDQGVRMTDHGDPDAAGKGNNLKVVRDDIAKILAAVQAVQDPAVLAALIAGKLEITGITTDPGGTVTVTFGAKAVP